MSNNLPEWADFVPALAEIIGGSGDARLTDRGGVKVFGPDVCVRVHRRPDGMFHAVVTRPFSFSGGEGYGIPALSAISNAYEDWVRMIGQDIEAMRKQQADRKATAARLATLTRCR